jgi:hypothetical protein
VQRLHLGYHWQHGMGELVTRTTRDADKVRDALITFWRQIIETPLVVIVAVGLTVAATEQYLESDNSIASATAFSETLLPRTIWWT